MRPLAFVLAAVLLQACYVSVPIGTAVPDPGTSLSLRLTDVGADSLAGMVGPGVSAVRGNLVGGGGDSLVLAVQAVQLRSGSEQFWKGEQVTIPRPMVAIVSERKLSRWRTGLLAGLAVVGLSVAIESAKTTGISGATNGGGGGAQQ